MYHKTIEIFTLVRGKFTGPVFHGFPVNTPIQFPESVENGKFT